ncbi:hypothetical protein JHK87_037501 [Glycine soja]|nr:hypothetical protein JHK87_037501 [Glycine soja]
MDSSTVTRRCPLQICVRETTTTPPHQEHHLRTNYLGQPLLRAPPPTRPKSTRVISGHQIRIKAIKIGGAKEVWHWFRDERHNILFEVIGRFAGKIRWL